MKVPSGLEEEVTVESIKARMCQLVLPLHDDEQTLLPVMHVLIEIQNANDVRPPRNPPVKLHFSSRFGTVVQNLEGQ